MSSLTQCLSISDLLSLREKVKVGSLSASDLRDLEQRYSKSRLGEKIREYLYTGDLEALTFTPAEAFRSIVYRTSIRKGEPVMKNGKFIPSPGMDEVSEDLPVIYSRDYLFSDLLVGYWQDEPTEKIILESGSRVEIARHAPWELSWKGTDYVLVAESANKSFYFPKDRIPDYIRPWLTCKPQQRSELATGLKRQGYKIDSLKGIKLHREMIRSRRITLKDGSSIDLFSELGVLVLEDQKYSEIEAEIGLPCGALQSTLWFDNGTYFKGTITSSSMSGLMPGFYGGLKFSPGNKNKSTVSILGSVMDEYSLVPWTPSLNRQQTDYASMELPLRTELPAPSTWIKAVSGFPAFVKQFNDEIAARAYQLFQKIRVSGYAGKVSLGTSPQPVQFIIRGPEVSDSEVRETAFLFSPSLPVHTRFMKVKVLFIRDKSLSGNLIQLNLHENNLSWVAHWYMAWAGRDCDGDGITLSDDRVVLNRTVEAAEIKWINTLSFKSQPDIKVASGHDAVRTSAGRIRTALHLVGKYDKAARRILRYDKKLLNWNLRVQLTEAIQRSISAQKKNSASDKFEGYWWLLKHLPQNASSWLFPKENNKPLNPHDAIDNFAEITRKYLRMRSGFLCSHLNEKEHIRLQKEIEKTAKNLEISLSVLSSVMPEHTRAAEELLSLTMEADEDNLHRIKAKSRSLWESAQSQTSLEEIKELLNLIDRSKILWRSLAGNRNQSAKQNLSHKEVVHIVSTWMCSMAEKNYHLTVSAMIKELSYSLLGRLLTLKDLKYLKLVDGFYLPATINGEEIKAGMLGKKQTFKSVVVHQGFLYALDDKETYKIVEIKPFRNYLWLPNRQVNKPVTHIIRIVKIEEDK